VMNRTNFVRSQSHGFSPEGLLMTLKDEWKVLWTELGQYREVCFRSNL
jgi:hypothetical protein